MPKQLANPARHALQNAGYNNLEQLSKISVDELKRLHGIGPNAIKILQTALREMGLSFADGGRPKK